MVHNTNTMKVYCQFKVLSTGYIQGTIPPKFSEDNKRPIDMLGSEGVYILDARNNLDNMILSCEKRLKQLQKSIVGYEIIRAERFTDKVKTIYSKTL